MKKQKTQINIKAAKNALQNNCHVEYFLYCVFKSFKSSSGKLILKDLDLSKINSNTLIKNLKTNFYFQKNQGCVYLKNYRIIQPDCDNYVVDFDEITQYACRAMSKRKNIIKTWDSTNIKYFLLCVVACHKEKNAPYALSLIKEDTGQSISTIQRALKTFDVIRDHKQQVLNSPRCYYYEGGRVNLTPNFNKMPVGKMHTEYV